MTEADDAAEAVTPKRAKAHWRDSADVPQMLSSECLLAYVEDLVYLTFGQLQVQAGGAESPSSFEVQPTARIVLTETAFHKIWDMFNRIGDQIPDPRPKKEPAAK